MKNIFFKHGPALILAIFIGLTIVLPTILSIEKIGLNNFKGIYPILSGDESHYMAMTREVYDGHSNMGNPYIKEYKGEPYTQPPLAEMYYAGFAKLFNISVPASGMVNYFILPFITLLLLYGFFFKLTQSYPFAKKISLIFSALFFLFLISSFNRPVNPQFSFIFLLLGLHLVWLIVDEKHSVRRLIIYNILLSIIFGILVYIYPFYWQTIVVLYVILTLTRMWLEKDFVYWLKNWASFFIPALIWSVPFLLNLRKLSANPLFIQTVVRNGYIYTHIPGAFLNVIPLFFCIPIMYLVQRLNKGQKSWQDKKTVFFGWALIISGVLLNWQNIVTGVTLQFSAHFYMVMVLFVFIIGLISILHIQSVEIKKIFTISNILVLLLLVIFIGIGYRQKNELLNTISKVYSPIDISSAQNMSGVMKWLNSNTASDSVVYTLGDDYNLAIPVYTHDNIYYLSSANVFLMSDSELQNRWAILHFFDNIDSSDVVKASRDIWPDRFIDAYQSKEVRRKILEFITGKKYSETVLLDQSYIDQVVQIHKDFQKMGFEKAIKTYSVDYVMLDMADVRYARLNEKFNTYTFLKKAVQIGSVIIYKVQ